MYERIEFSTLSKVDILPSNLYGTERLVCNIDETSFILLHLIFYVTSGTSLMKLDPIKVEMK